MTPSFDYNYIFKTKNLNIKLIFFFFFDTESIESIPLNIYTVEQYNEIDFIHVLNELMITYAEQNNN